MRSEPPPIGSDDTTAGTELRGLSPPAQLTLLGVAQLMAVGEGLWLLSQVIRHSRPADWHGWNLLGLILVAITLSALGTGGAALLWRRPHTWRLAVVAERALLGCLALIAAALLAYILGWTGEAHRSERQLQARLYLWVIGILCLLPFFAGERLSLPETRALYFGGREPVNGS